MPSPLPASLVINLVLCLSEFYLPSGWPGGSGLAGGKSRDLGVLWSVPQTWGEGRICPAFDCVGAEGSSPPSLGYPEQGFS